MTKKELIKLLESIPDDAIIVKEGHSDSCGFNDISEITPIQIREDQDWSGKYHESPHDAFKAYVIS